MTITFHPYAGSRRKDDTRQLFIRVTFKRKSRKIATTITCHPEDVSRSGKVKSPAILNKYDALVRQMRDAASQLSPFALDAMEVDDVVAHVRKVIAGQAFRLDFVAFGRDAVKNRTNGTQANYSACLDALAAYAKTLGKETIDVNDITKSLLLDFRDWVQTPAFAASRHGRGVSAEQAVRYLAKLATIHRLAKERYNDEDAGVINIPRSPFTSLKLTAPLAGGQVQTNLGVPMMQRVISAALLLAETPKADEGLAVALSAFVLSFGLMGMNGADLYEAKPLKDGVITYNRKKTRTRRDDAALMKVTVDERLAPLVAVLSSGRGGWWLDRLRRYAHQQSLDARLNRNLRRWCRYEGLPEFTFYAARKSWASIARNNAGVDKATVDECLCHRGDLRLADIYIEKDWSLLWKANAKVLDLFSWG